MRTAGKKARPAGEPGAKETKDTGTLSPAPPKVKTLPLVVRVLKRTAAWCWQDKAVLRAIREAFDATNDVSSALAVYLALTEIASDKEAEVFDSTHAWIARMSGLSVRTVQSRLKTLAELGLVSIDTPNLRAPSTYRLLSFGNDCTTLSNGCRAFGNGQKQASLPTSEEHKKKLFEERGKKPAVVTTAERIGLERNRSLLTERIKALEADLYYPWQRQEHPAKVQELEVARARLRDIEARLLT